ncbi:CBS and ACT domain-containing protein [Maridesulfovibrio hydrothermalis]|uniref:CBS domain containing membrane protein n=1 Tax=Maridesulfovibrio hydrothermalis AM13 = DSM 14728 TaxID=1121451 RepID=L0R9V3_9BACT|nr:CBS and ACT domain-containing protein [Maridesulfovibrio hydrothermalis]CCO22955.1 CBS domain containing membrane protein [Maridesulfovibrio hydrothermalis AM13 = DSM 14728]
MLVKNWMTKEVITLTHDRSMMKAAKLMKDNAISRLPIVDDDGVLVGIISDRDIKEASPSKATTLDMHELYYLLSEIKVKDIMSRKVITVSIEETVEKAAVVMDENKIGGIPVVDTENKCVGIITNTDVFKVLIQITGVMHGGVQIGLALSNEPGSLNGVLDYLKDNNARVMSILTSYEPEQENMRHVFIRINDMDKADLNKIKAGIAENFNMMFWVRDSVHGLTS